MTPDKTSPAGKSLPAGILLAFVCATAAFAAVAFADSATRDDLDEKDAARVAAVTALATDFSAPEPFERMSAGAATSLATVTRDSFSHPAANLTFEGERDFKLGNGLFKKLWVSAPSSTQASDGLGPLYNARSCQRCHLKDGRGHPPEGPDDTATSMFLRLSVPARTDAERKALAEKALLRIPEPTYGGQLQDFAIPGLKAEGRLAVSYKEIPFPLGDGTVINLRKPAYSVTHLGYGAMDPEVMLSPRVAPQMIGLGLVESIHPADILSRADPDDTDGDGISGKPSIVRDPQTHELVLGRFGWKASTSTIHAQTADAFAGDIGISSPAAMLPYGDCTPRQAECLTRQTGIQPRLGDSEAPDPVLDLVVFYSRNLAVPARRDVADRQVLHGKKLFYEAGCVACHTPKYVTRRDAEQPEHRFQLIWPYSDFLLHDMGGDLGDGRPLGDAGGNEWRTAPLWGIGLTETVNGHTYFLHDGRARNLLEAILWHGGEAQVSRDAVVAMDKNDRDALIRFLESL